MKLQLFVGLISGTSVDGIDAALVCIDEDSVNLVATHSHPYPDAVRDRLLHAIRHPDTTTVDDVCTLDALVGEAFRDAALTLIRDSGHKRSDIKAIGSHGQTLRHRPDAEPRFTLQIGNPAIISTGTGITTVADFRRQDLALGGQGAPLVPPFHAWLFRETGRTVTVANIGGIANVTILPGDATPTRGFDTGPGNTLLDAWCRRHRSEAYDDRGRWAASGSVEPALLEKLLADECLARPAPKSTGFEHYNLAWLESLGVAGIPVENVQATLLEFTAQSLTDAIKREAPDCRALYLCGGGVHNIALTGRIETLLPGVSVASTAERGLDPDWVEAAAFAWLARERTAGRTGNLPEVTGASRSTSLGAIYRV